MSFECPRHGTILYGKCCTDGDCQCKASSSNSGLLDCRIVTAEGQLEKGSKLRIIGKNTRDDQYATVKEIVTINGNEEVIINKKKNYYFITKMLVAGKSWAKQVQILP